MTCGEWGKPGHQDHICIDCKELFHSGCHCPIGSCGFVLVSPEILKIRDELFSSKKVTA
jgi:hypothetical protein